MDKKISEAYLAGLTDALILIQRAMLHGLTYGEASELLVETIQDAQRLKEVDYARK